MKEVKGERWKSEESVYFETLCLWRKGTVGTYRKWSMKQFGFGI